MFIDKYFSINYFVISSCFLLIIDHLSLKLTIISSCSSCLAIIINNFFIACSSYSLYWRVEHLHPYESGMLFYKLAFQTLEWRFYRGANVKICYLCHNFGGILIFWWYLQTNWSWIWVPASRLAICWSQSPI